MPSRACAPPRSLVFLQWMELPIMDSVYELYRRGCDLLNHGDYQAAIVPLTPSPGDRARQGLDP